MKKHTQGPWQAERVYLTIEDPTMRITAFDGALYVAEAAYTHIRGEKAIHVSDADEMRANACLIAAAPELLAALEDALSIFKDALSIFKFAEDDKTVVAPKWVARAEAAIAKAEGR